MFMESLIWYLHSLLKVQIQYSKTLNVIPECKWFSCLNVTILIYFFSCKILLNTILISVKYLKSFSMVCYFIRHSMRFLFSNITSHFVVAKFKASRMMLVEKNELPSDCKICWSYISLYDTIQLYKCDVDFDGNFKKINKYWWLFDWFWICKSDINI